MTKYKTRDQLLAENVVLFELAVSGDAHRMCDSSSKIIFGDQLVRSRKHIEYLLTQMTQQQEKTTKG